MFIVSYPFNVRRAVLNDPNPIPSLTNLFILKANNHLQHDLLLFNFLQELIYYKDSQQLLLWAKQVLIEEKQATYHLKAITQGEKLNRDRHH